MACDFTFRHYSEIIKKALDAGYKFYTFSDYLAQKPTGKAMLLRHDIDNYFYRTGDFAEVENKLGVKATYFFRVHSTYNIFEYNNFKIIRELEEHGHEVGLHSEIGDFEKFNPGIGHKELLEREKKVIETCLGHEIKGFSCHRDFDYQVNSLPLVRQIDFKLLGFAYEAYQDEFHDSLKYISETLNPHIGWRDGCPCTFVGKEPVICLLAHPAWWFHNHPREGER